MLKSTCTNGAIVHFEFSEQIERKHHNTFIFINHQQAILTVFALARSGESSHAKIAHGNNRPNDH